MLVLSESLINLQKVGSLSQWASMSDMALVRLVPISIGRKWLIHLSNA